jgi:hypothetical protein
MCAAWFTAKRRRFEPSLEVVWKSQLCNFTEFNSSELKFVFIFISGIMGLHVRVT